MNVDLSNFNFSPSDVTENRLRAYFSPLIIERYNFQVARASTAPVGKLSKFAEIRSQAINFLVSTAKALMALERILALLRKAILSLIG